ncbi:MAG TPA: hypothetical protein VEH29_14510 [Acidimicrobiales bacterium]|nr:hypothetical protein [Acidimicrobiales bacterium]
MTLSATAHHPAAFVATFTVFVVLSLVLIGFVVRFAVKLDRSRKAAAARGRRRRPPGP